MSEQQVGIGFFVVAVALLAAWPMPSTAPDFDRARVDIAAASPSPERAEPRRATAARSRVARVPSTSTEPLALALAGTDAPAPPWKLVDPEKSHVDWNAEMGELLTAYTGCPEVYPIDDDDDSPLAYAMDGLRQMFEDEAFDPNSSVGSYQIASEATKSVRELLELEGCI